MYYFAYGSNMNHQRMKARNAKFRFAKKAYLKDYRLRFNKLSSKKSGEGVANIVYENGCIVEGVLYKIDTNGLANLDRYESYPNAYRRELLEINISDFEVLKAHVYIANSNHVAENLLPSEYYVQHLLKARDYLSEEYYRFLLNHPTL